MKVSEMKQKIDFFSDALFQAGYERGRDAALTEIEEYEDCMWNQGNKATADVCNKLLKELRYENEVE